MYDAFNYYLVNANYNKKEYKNRVYFLREHKYFL